MVIWMLVDQVLMIDQWKKDRHDEILSFPFFSFLFVIVVFFSSFIFADDDDSVKKKKTDN